MLQVGLVKWDRNLLQIGLFTCFFNRLNTYVTLLYEFVLISYKSVCNNFLFGKMGWQVRFR